MNHLTVKGSLKDNKCFLCLLDSLDNSRCIISHARGAQGIAFLFLFLADSHVVYLFFAASLLNKFGG